MTSPRSLRKNILWSTAFLLAATLGIFLRVHSFEPAPPEPGFDEQLYSTYVKLIGQHGVGYYPVLVDHYLQKQNTYPTVLLPPTRVTFILASSAWQLVSGWTPVECVRAVSCAASVLLLLFSCAFVWRLRGNAFALAILFLMAVAPMQIYMAHRALIDGFFSFITLLVIWSLWEVLQDSQSPRLWLLLYAVSLTLLVLTKENAAFVEASLLGLLIMNRWFHFGRISKPVLLVTLAAPVLGLILAALCAGGFKTLATVYSLNVSKSIQTPYAILTGDGPWFRYLSDLLLVSPAVMLFAIGGVFLLDRTKTEGWYFFGFIFFSYLWMCNVKYGMNLRYAIIWDFPLRFLALTPLFIWAERIHTESRRTLFLISTVGMLCLFELDSYIQIFVDNAVYDPISTNLLHALQILKP